MYKEMNEVFPKKVEISVTEEMVRHYAEVSGDRNPVHFSKDAAGQAGYPERVAHGMLTMAICARMVSPLLGKEAMIQSYQMKFLAPVYVNDTLTISASLLSKSEMKVSGKNENGQAAIKGRLTLAAI